MDDNFIKSFFNLCVKIYKYNDENKNIEIKNLDEFIEKCNELLELERKKEEKKAYQNKYYEDKKEK